MHLRLLQEFRCRRTHSILARETLVILEGILELWLEGLPGYAGNPCRIIQ